MKLFSLNAVEIALQKYQDNGGEVYMIREGTLLDDYVAMLPGYKTMVARAKYLNDSSSAYRVTFYNKTPKKYLEIIAKL